MKLNEFIEKASRPRKRLNKALLKQVAARLRNLKHEAHYDQGEWAEKNECGTACCIAGWTLIEAGLSQRQLVTINEGDKTWNEKNAPLRDQHFESAVAGLAQNLLGLGSDQAYQLFSGGGRGWPDGYDDRYDAAVNGESNERPSQVAASLLDAIASVAVTL